MSANPPPGKLTSHLIDEHYRLLLRDGIIIWPPSPGASFHPDCPEDAWRDALQMRTVRDGLRGELRWFGFDDIWWWPFFWLLHPDGSRYPLTDDDGGRRAEAPSQRFVADQIRPRVERDWAATLDRARERSGQKAAPPDE